MCSLALSLSRPSDFSKKGTDRECDTREALDSARTAPGKAAVAPTPMPFQAPFRDPPLVRAVAASTPATPARESPRGQRHRAPRLRRAARYPATRHECIAAAADRARTNGHPAEVEHEDGPDAGRRRALGTTSGASRPNVAPARVTGRPSRRSKLNTTSAAPVARTMAPRSLKDVKRLEPDE